MRYAGHYANDRKREDQSIRSGKILERRHIRICRITDRRSAACGNLPTSLVDTSDGREPTTPHIGTAEARPLQRIVRPRALRY